MNHIPPGREVHPIEGEPLLQVSGLEVDFSLGSGKVLKAVDGVDLFVRPGEILGLVGESGCGKSVFCLSVLRLIDAPGRVRGTGIYWKGRDLLRAGEEDLRQVRGREIAIIFQNAQAALNPVFRVGRQIETILRSLRKLDATEARIEALRLLRLVHIPDPEITMNRYPHQLSGGMCQRILIAMALSGEPRLLIADEPTASLDVTIQAEILDLLLEIRERLGMAILFVSHDLGVIARMCDRVAVMYLGRIVEIADYRSLYSSPKHPYTRALLRSVPLADPTHRNVTQRLKGDVPSGAQIPPGCRFHPRCPEAISGVCERVDPPLVSLGANGTKVACVLYDSVVLQGAKTGENPERETNPDAGCST